MYDKPIFLPAGDRALVVELGDAIEPETNRRVRDLMLAIQKADLRGVSELVPSYRSLLVYYDPVVTSAEAVQTGIGHAEQNLSESVLERPRVVHIPTLYGGEYGPDLGFVADHAGLTPDEAVELHSGTDYLVYMIGFSPGFPYLGGLPEPLITPRLEIPRVEIPAGSVGIAESQTGVYPVASPAGWRLVGRTPLRLFDSDKNPPSLLSAGAYVRFVPLATEEEYLSVRQSVETGEYEVVTEVVA